MEFPSALLGVALGTVLLRRWRRHHSRRSNTRPVLRAARLGPAPRAPARVARGHRTGSAGRCPWSRRSTSTAASPSTTCADPRRASATASGLLGLIVVRVAPGFYARQVIDDSGQGRVRDGVVSQRSRSLLMLPLGHAGLTLSTSNRRVLQRHGALHLCAVVACYVPHRDGLVSSRRLAGRAGGVSRRGLAGLGGSVDRSGCGVAWAPVGRLGRRSSPPAPSPTSARVGARLPARRLQSCAKRIPMNRPRAISSPEARSDLQERTFARARCDQSLLPAFRTGSAASRTRRTGASVLGDLEAAVACAIFDLAPLDLGVVELLDAAALEAHQVVVVLALVELEHRLAGFEVVALSRPACSNWVSTR